MRSARRLCLVAAALALALPACGSTDRPAHPQVAAPAAKAKPAYRIAPDHDYYPTAEALRERADAIAIGTPLSSAVIPGVSPGNDAAGDPVPGVPHTEYTVRVDSPIKGTSAAGATILVSLPGGETAQGRFSAEGVVELKIGAQALFFLKAGDDGRFYPLAAGTAIRLEQADGTFAMRPEATGAEASLPLTEAQARGIGTPAAPAPTATPAPKPTAPAAKKLELTKTKLSYSRTRDSPCSRSRSVVAAKFSAKLERRSGKRSASSARSCASPAATAPTRSRSSSAPPSAGATGYAQRERGGQKDHQRRQDAHGQVAPSRAQGSPRRIGEHPGHAADPRHRRPRRSREAAEATAEGAALFYAFGNFCALAARPDLSRCGR